MRELHSLRFEATARLYGGEQALARLAAAHVCVVGLGGVGSWAVEALARAGVGSLTLLDLDEVCVSNTNRQLHALEHSVGAPKARVLAERCAAINPDCLLSVREQWLTLDDADAIVREELDRASPDGGVAFLDAIDGYWEKAALISACLRERAHVVTVGGSGGLLDPTRVRIGDLTTASGPLLCSTKSALRKAHGFPKGASQSAPAWGVPAVYSSERGAAPRDDGNDCARFGTAGFVTGTFGLVAASSLVDTLARNLPPPQLPAGASPPASPHPLKLPPLEPLVLAAVVDSHCHALESLDEYLARGLRGACFMSCTEADWAAAAAVTPGSAQSALGVHPWWLHKQAAGWQERLDARLAATPPTVAVGEIGLDRARCGLAAFDEQRAAFVVQLRLAAKHRRACVVHCVRAQGVLLDILRAEASLPPVLVLHAYGGSVETAAELLKLPGTRVYFGISASTARLARAASLIASLPPSRLLIESDEHTPAEALSAVSQSLRAVASACGWDEQEAACRTAENAREALGDIT